MRLRLVVVGKPRNPHMATAIADYEARAAHYWPLDVREVKEARSLAPADAQAKEWSRLREAAGDAALIVCDEQGDRHDSQAFAAFLDRLRGNSAQDAAFMIGGAFGLPESAKAAVDHRIALAPWTLPHELARLVLAEQLYRAGTIMRGEPYHK